MQTTIRTRFLCVGLVAIIAAAASGCLGGPEVAQEEGTAELAPGNWMCGGAVVGHAELPYAPNSNWLFECRSAAAADADAQCRAASGRNCCSDWSSSYAHVSPGWCEVYGMHYWVSE